MMLLRVYRLAARIGHRVPMARRSAVARAVSGRRTATERWLEWARTGRASGPLLWIHAASVGEAQTAVPVVTRLEAAMPHLQIVHSYSSSSVAEWPAPFTRAYADYIPLDEPKALNGVLDAVRPDIAVFARGDLWPEFVTQLESRVIPVAVIGASVRRGSLRLRTPARQLYQALGRAVSWIGAPTPDDAARWRRLGVPDDRIAVTGDPRHDQVLERVTNLTALGSLRGWADRGPTLVAGSVEPADEPVLLHAARRVLSGHPNAQCLVVPHAPERGGADRLVALAARHGLESDTWLPEQQREPAARYVVLAARGLLADLYALGSLAYVGGGFRAGTLHATIEPAAYGLPIAFGPRWDAHADAAALVRQGGAVSLHHRHPGARLAGQWDTWLRDAAQAREVGLAARAALRPGGASVTAQRLLQLLDPAVRDSGSSDRRRRPRT